MESTGGREARNFQGFLHKVDSGRTKLYIQSIT
jgi:hypothetical protein